MENNDISQQISHLRGILTKNYSDLCLARDFLSNLSINDISANYLQRNADDVFNEQEIDRLASGNNIDNTEHHINKIIKQQKINSMPDNDVSANNSLKIFCTTIGELHKNMKNLQDNHLIISKLNDTIYKSMTENDERIESIKKELQETASMDTIKSAEKLIKLEMSFSENSGASIIGNEDE